MELVKTKQTKGLKAIVLFTAANSDLYQRIDQNLEGFLKSLHGSDEKIRMLTTNGKWDAPYVIVVKTAPNEKPHGLEQLGGQLASLVQSHNLDPIAFDASGFSSEMGSILLGYLLRSLNPKNYAQSSIEQKKLLLFTEDDEAIQHLNKSVMPIYRGVALARELAGAPSNRMTPEIFSQKALELASLGLQVEVLDEKQIQREGLHALWAVGKSSSNKPRLVTLRWKGNPSQAPIAFVGKGVCFDAGGINIKTEHLLEMKWDKSGGAAVVGVLAAAALAKLPVNLIGVVGLAENILDGCCLKPGDVIDTHRKLTVEVIDTDYEGRLILADCLSYVQTISNPDIICDLGTLTPEVFAALADQYAGLFCEDEQLSKQLIAAGKRVGEPLWPLPMGEAFAKQIHSTIADVKNVGIPEFGECSAAAEFLKRFVLPGKRWAHLDIAGVAWSHEDRPLSPKGVTGFGVRLLFDWLLLSGPR